MVHPPPKNRVWGFRTPARYRIRKTTSQVMDPHQEIRFTVTTGASGVRYNWMRYYDPQLGRYLSPDPIGIKGGDLNLYAYVSNTPTTYYDADGRLIKEIICGGLAALMAWQWIHEYFFEEHETEEEEKPKADPTHIAPDLPEAPVPPGPDSLGKQPPKEPKPPKPPKPPMPKIPRIPRMPKVR